MKNWENGNRFNLDTVIKLLKLSKAKIFAKKEIFHCIPFVNILCQYSLIKNLGIPKSPNR